MEVCSRISELRKMVGAARRAGKSVGLVPTMGALHAGHRSLLARARQECDVVVMSLFVNPTQFNDKDDFAKYPRDGAADESIAREEGVDFVFEPDASEMYPEGFVASVNVPGLSEILEGKSRPGHYQGVATVVAKLLLIGQCDRAYFGLKDYQQLQVIRRMVADLNIPVQIIPCETVREKDGLAMSSRNARLTPDERSAAPVIGRSLAAAQALVDLGVRDALLIRDGIARIIEAEPRAKLDYAVVVDPDDLSDVAAIAAGAVALVAAMFGGVRLIDSRVLASAGSL